MIRQSEEYEEQIKNQILLLEPLLDQLKNTDSSSINNLTKKYYNNGLKANTLITNGENVIGTISK
jgi:hypothetical protein